MHSGQLMVIACNEHLEVTVMSLFLAEICAKDEQSQTSGNIIMSVLYIN
jgi:hypothetical protein